MISRCRRDLGHRREQRLLAMLVFQRRMDKVAPTRVWKALWREDMDKSRAILGETGENGLLQSPDYAAWKASVDPGHTMCGRLWLSRLMEGF